MNDDKSNLCRICLKDHASIPLFETSETKKCNLLSKLALCFNEKVEDIDGYPRSICIKCNNTIETIYSFIINYRETCKILANGVALVKNENYLSDEALSEVEIEIDGIKDEPDSDNKEECLPLIQLKLNNEIKQEVPNKAKCRKRLKIQAKSSKNDINKIASSILEGDFAWIGDVWCIKSTKQLKKNVQKPMPRRQKEIKIVKQKVKKKPEPPPARLCDICGEIFKDQDKLNAHKKKVHYKEYIKCPKCPRLIVSNYYLNRHLKRSHDTKGKNFVCPTCGRAFAFKGELSTHIKNVHNKHLKAKKTYACSICKKTYKCAKSVLIHERSAHTGLRPAICATCGTSFYHEDYLKEHMRLHTGETPFKCPICGRGYAQRCNMKSHLRIHRISELDANTLSKLKPNYLKLLKV